MDKLIKRHIVVELSDKEQRALKVMAGIRGEFIQDLVRTVLLKEISQYNHMLTEIDGKNKNNT